MEARRTNQMHQLEPEAWPKVAIIILNWNGWRDTFECLGNPNLNQSPNTKMPEVIKWV